MYHYALMFKPPQLYSFSVQMAFQMNLLSEKKSAGKSYRISKEKNDVLEISGSALSVDKAERSLLEPLLKSLNLRDKLKQNLLTDQRRHCIGESILSCSTPLPHFLIISTYSSFLFPRFNSMIYGLAANLFINEHSQTHALLHTQYDTGRKILHYPQKIRPWKLVSFRAKLAENTLCSHRPLHEEDLIDTDQYHEFASFEGQATRSGALILNER